MRHIQITESDRERLRELIYVGQHGAELDADSLLALDKELSDALIVPSDEVRQDVITVHSRVRIRNLGSGEEMVFTLVYPGAADVEHGKISVLTPLGTGLLGCRVGDVIEWRIPDGIRKLKIMEIEYQPESAGHYHL